MAIVCHVVAIILIDNCAYMLIQETSMMPV